MQTNLINLAVLGTRGIPAHYGGFETFAEELATRLVANGVEVTVYCEASTDQSQPDTYQGVRLIYLPVYPCGPLTTILFDLRCFWHARKAFNVVYMLGYGAAPFCFIPRLWGSRVWLNVDGIEWARSKWGRLARVYFKLMECFSLWTPNRVIADAQAIHDHLRKRHSRKTPCSVIPYGAQLITKAPPAELLAEWELTPEGYYLIVCRLEPENHLREMLEGFMRSHSSKKLVVVGNHRVETPYVRSLLPFDGPRIHFIGTVFNQEKLQALRFHAYAYCHGHSVGGTNPSLLEALGCGNAVIAHDNPFNREVAENAADYFSSSDEFCRLIDYFDQAESDRQRMRLTARQRIAERYTWERITAEYSALLASDLAIEERID